MAKNQKDVLAAMFPGTTFEIKSDRSEDKLVATIYPMGIAHVRRFNKAVEDVLPKIAMQVPLNHLGGKLDLSTLAPMIVPIIIGDLLDLVNACVDGVDLTDEKLPHWVLASIIQIWIEESFGDQGKVKPWIDIIDKTIAKMTGKNPQIWQTLCKLSSDSDTTSTTSSTVSGGPVLTRGGQSQ